MLHKSFGNHEKIFWCDILAHYVKPTYQTDKYSIKNFSWLEDFLVMYILSYRNIFHAVQQFGGVGKVAFFCPNYHLDFF